MGKVKFYLHPQVGKEVTTADDKYVLLSYYLAQRKDKKTLERVTNELQIVKSGEKTFEEVFEETYGVIDIGYGAGEFECNKDTAYFISNHPVDEPSVEIPLQELIDILKEWYTFLYS